MKKQPLHQKMAGRQSYLPLLGNNVDEEIHPDIVHIRHQEGRVVWGTTFRVYELIHPCLPVLPISCQSGKKITTKAKDW